MRSNPPAPSRTSSLLRVNSEVALGAERVLGPAWQVKKRRSRICYVLLVVALGGCVTVQPAPAPPRTPTAAPPPDATQAPPAAAAAQPPPIVTPAAPDPLARADRAGDSAAAPLHAAPKLESQAPRALARPRVPDTKPLHLLAAAPPQPTPNNPSIVRVFYGTDRNKSGDPSPSLFYGGLRGNRSIDFGICSVSIPPTHQVGNLETPFMASIPVLSRWAKEDPQKHVMITGLTQLTQQDFLTHVRYAIEASAAHDAFIFIHGYNNTFADGCRRTAQIAYDLGFRGAPILYSWPSAGGAAKYLEDDGNADWTLQQFETFLTLLATQTNARTIHLVAHSTGARVLAKTLASLAKRQPQGLAFEQTVFAAADVDASDFASQYLPAIKSLSKRTTLYVSSTDEALHLAMKLRKYPRAGEAGDNMLVLEGADTIDVSPIDTSLLGHSYLTTKPVFQDLFELLHQGTGPAERCKLVVTCYLETLKWKNGLDYWRFLSLGQ